MALNRAPFRYLFRFCCDPGFNDEKEIEALEQYTREALIDDAVVFANVEEINTGHMSFSEQDKYLSMMKKIGKTLEKTGCTFSVNQWHSVMHADLGKTLRPDQHFRRMVDMNGQEASLCVCPLCREWQQYIGHIYQRYARLDASILWVEDDFRLHNHDPLVWGGCFCEEHMRLYSQRAGKSLIREEFIKGVLKPGQPHPYRKIWLDVSRETLLSAAAAINKAIREVNSQVSIGLMSSVPYIHAAEGRDWHQLLQILCRGQAPVDRVHLPAYQEMAPSQYLHRFNMISMQCASMLPGDCAIYPELENYPFSRFSKSHAFTRFQLLSALPLGNPGITLDLYDLNGNGIVWEEGYQRVLRDTKPYLCEMTDLGVFGGAHGGIKVLYSPDSSYTLHTEKGQSMEELYPREGFFAAILPAFGIPFAYTDTIEDDGEPYAMTGQVLRNFSHAEIESLFRDHPVLLDGEAAETLCDMGLGNLAGIERVKWMKQDSGEYTYEETVDDGVYCGRQHARASAVISCSDALHVTYAPDAQTRVYSAFYDSYRQKKAPCMVRTRGRVILYPFGHFPDPMSIPAMLLTTARKEILQKMLRDAGIRVPMVENAPYLEPYLRMAGGKKYLYLVNGSLDTAENIRISCPGLSGRGSVILWPSEGKRAEAVLETQNGIFLLPRAISPMESLLVLLPDHEKGEAQ